MKCLIAKGSGFLEEFGYGSSFSCLPLRKCGGIYEWTLSGGSVVRSSTVCPGGSSVYAVPGATLSDLNLTQAYLVNADLGNADLGNANLSNANLYAATLADANLTGTNLSNANLYAATLTNANLSNATVAGANFGSTTLSSSQLYSTASYQAGEPPRHRARLQQPERLELLRAGPEQCQPFVPAR